MCLPLLTFSAIIDDIYIAKPENINIIKYVASDIDRNTILPELMPKHLCDKNKKSDEYYTIDEISSMSLRSIR